MKIKVTIKPEPTEFIATVEHCKGFTIAPNLDQLQKNVRDLIYLEATGRINFKEDCPKVLTNYTYLELRFDVSKYLCRFPVSISNLAVAADMNRTLLNRYVNGQLMSLEQFQRIQKGLRKIVMIFQNNINDYE